MHVMIVACYHPLDACCTLTLFLYFLALQSLHHKTNFTCSACEQTRKWRLKLTLVRLQTWSLTALGEGMKILCIKDHVHSSINDFHERIRAITNPSFAVGCLN